MQSSSTNPDAASEAAPIDLDNDGALFSPDRRYRYALWRKLGRGRKILLVVGLNPSTADERHNDPTIRRCIGFARCWGYGRLIVANLFAFRATQPADLKRAADPVGPDNDLWLRRLDELSTMTLAAWGVHGAYRDRGDETRVLLGPCRCLGLTAAGLPRHPLYVRKDRRPRRF